ncbi:MAG: peptidoglycan-binding protein [Eubacteriales bacterium]|nr:peptidoglycan-binding protein [Eubacteriales bacterium]
MSKISEFKALLEEQVGKGIYVWGGDGEILSAMTDPVAWIKKHETSTPNAARAVALYNKRVSGGVETIRAFDCSGLMYYCLSKIGVVKSDLNSRGLYGICTPIAKQELRCGDLIFCWDDKDGDGFDVSEIYHVGAYVGDGKVIECQGRDVGVVENKLSSRWNAFGRPKAFKDLVAESPADPTTEPDGYYREISVQNPYMRGADVKWVQTTLVALGYSVGKSGIDGIYGEDTACAVAKFQRDAHLVEDGIVGLQTWSAIATAITALVAPTGALMGDADGDGKLTAADAAKILRSIVHLEDALPLIAGDANNDGEITSADAAYILRCVVGLDKPIPAKEG